MLFRSNGEFEKGVELSRVIVPVIIKVFMFFGEISISQLPGSDIRCDILSCYPFNAGPTGSTCMYKNKLMIKRNQNRVFLKCTDKGGAVMVSIEPGGYLDPLIQKTFMAICSYNSSKGTFSKNRMIF